MPDFRYSSTVVCALGLDLVELLAIIFPTYSGLAPLYTV